MMLFGPKPPFATDLVLAPSVSGALETHVTGRTFGEWPKFAVGIYREQTINGYYKVDNLILISKLDTYFQLWYHYCQLVAENRVLVP